MLLRQMPGHLHKAIQNMSDLKMVKVMDMMKKRMRYEADIQNHAYLWTDPDYQTDLGAKFLKKLKRKGPENAQVLKELEARFRACESWSAEVVNRTCSEYLFEQGNLNNEDVFYLLRYALTGNPVGAPIGEIAEVISKKEVVFRCGDAQAVFN